MRLGFLGLPIDRPKGPRRNFLEGYEGCDAAWAAWSSGSKVFPGSCLMLLNVINPWDVRASLLKETGRATGEVALSTHTYACTGVRSISILYQGRQSHETCCRSCHCELGLYCSLRAESIWFAIDLEDDSSSADAYHVMTSVFEVGGKHVEASQFI